MDSITYLRSFRLHNIALFDLVLAFGAARVVAGTARAYAAVLPLSVVAHWIFGTNTSFMRMLAKGDCLSWVALVLSLAHLISKA